MASFTTNVMPTNTSLPHELLTGLWNMFSMQLTPFNTSGVIAVPSSVYNALDDGAKKFFVQSLQDLLGLPIILIRDGTHYGRYLLGPAQEFLRIPSADIIQLSDQNLFIIRNPNYSKASQNTEASVPAQPSVKTDVRIHRVPRPPNAYILYRKDNHHKVKAANPGITNNEISVILGSRWNQESVDIRAEYAAKAERVKKEFMKENPNYKYQPRRPEEKKRRNKRPRLDNNTLDDHVTSIRRLDHMTSLEERDQTVSIEMDSDLPDLQDESPLFLDDESIEFHVDDADDFSEELDEYFNAPQDGF